MLLHSPGEPFRHSFQDSIYPRCCVYAAFAGLVHRLRDRNADFFCKYFPNRDTQFGKLHHFFGGYFPLGLHLAEGAGYPINFYCPSAQRRNGITDSGHHREDLPGLEAEGQELAGRSGQPFKFKRRFSGKVPQITNKFIRMFCAAQHSRKGYFGLLHAACKLHAFYACPEKRSPQADYTCSQRLARW